MITFRHLVPTLAVAGVLLAGCSGGGGGATTSGPVPTALSTTTTTVAGTTTMVAPTTSTTVAGVTSTRPVVTAAPPTTDAPARSGGSPQMTATPSGAPVGVWVRLEGTGFQDEMWNTSGGRAVVGRRHDV